MTSSTGRLGVKSLFVTRDVCLEDVVFFISAAGATSVETPAIQILGIRAHALTSKTVRARIGVGIVSFSLGRLAAGAGVSVGGDGA
jgi:hypothetical protein